jgi:hypothetical protein
MTVNTSERQCPGSVGRKTRRAQNIVVQIEVVAPVLSRPKPCRAKCSIFRNGINTTGQFRWRFCCRAHAWLKTGATAPLHTNALGAPSFSPYRSWALSFIVVRCRSLPFAAFGIDSRIHLPTHSTKEKWNPRRTMRRIWLRILPCTKSS